MKAYITLLSNDRYFDGVVMLYRALRNVQSRYPLYCMLSASVEDVIMQRLENEGIKCIRLKQSVIKEIPNQEGLTFSHWSHTFDKLQAWGLIEFEKLIFVDADMLVRYNLDFLFERQAFTAVSAGCSYPTNTAWRGLNSGLIVIEPDKNIEQELFNLAQQVITEFMQNGDFVGDQDVINRYIPDWHLKTELHLSEGYNLFADYLTWYVRNEGFSWTGENGTPIFIVHFIGRQKPWMKKNLRNWAWYIRECYRNPYYRLAYNEYISYLKR